MTLMSAAPGNRIQCYRCGHVFDHNPRFSRHCLCKGCGVSIAIPDARRTYAASSNIGGAGNARSTPIPQAVPVDAPLPPICRDEHGQPLPKPKPDIRTPDKPRNVADDFEFINRRMKQLQAEKEARVAGEGGEDESEGDFSF